MEKFYRKSIGIFGGSFDPPHYGHLKISKIALKKFKFERIFWAVTKKNPFKKKPYFSLKDRLQKSKEISRGINNIKVVHLDKKLKSSRTIKLVKYFLKKIPNRNIFLILGSDNLIGFHKWQSYKEIVKNCRLIVFPRKGFDKKAKKSVIIKVLGRKNILFIKNAKIDISSTKIRINYKKN